MSICRQYSDYQMSKPEDFPSGPHYVVVCFETKQEYEPDYHSRTGATYAVTVTKTEVYAFSSKDELEQMISFAMKSDIRFVFYKVESLGQAKINIDIKA